MVRKGAWDFVLIYPRFLQHVLHDWQHAQIEYEEWHGSLRDDLQEHLDGSREYKKGTDDRLAEEETGDAVTPAASPAVPPTARRRSISCCCGGICPRNAECRTQNEELRRNGEAVFLHSCLRRRRAGGVNSRPGRPARHLVVHRPASSGLHGNRGGGAARVTAIVRHVHPELRVRRQHGRGEIR